jgi:hypothetical protein
MSGGQNPPNIAYSIPSLAIELAEMANTHGHSNGMPSQAGGRASPQTLLRRFSCPRLEAPEQLVAALAQAARNGDKAALVSDMTKSSQQALRKARETNALLIRAQQNYQAALDMRFGKGHALLPSRPPDQAVNLSRLANLELSSVRNTDQGKAESESGHARNWKSYRRRGHGTGGQRGWPMEARIDGCNSARGSPRCAANVRL